MNKVIVIIGPTASGKTQLSIELAKRLDTEIISADSMQVYKYMDIGTAKPTIEEMSGIRHYMIDEVNPDENFSVAGFQQLAVEYIEEIASRGKVPIVAGGTGLYVNSLLHNINFTETVSDLALREQLKREAEENGNEYLHRKLEEVDPDAAARIHINDIKRIIRALEVYNYTKKTISYHQKVSREIPPKYQYIVIGLMMDRQKLYDRINRRVDLMLEKGLVEEVKRLVELGYDNRFTAMQAIGYKEIISYLRGEISFDEAVYIIKRDSRHYAKRQLTWFRRLEDVFWIDLDKCIDANEILKNIQNYIATYGIFL